MSQDTGPGHGGRAGRQEGPTAGYAAVAGEALRLIEALQHAATGWAGAGAHRGSHDSAGCGCDGCGCGGAGADGKGADGAGADGPPVACRACPVCRLLGALHRARPGAVEHLADAGASFAAALAELAAAATTAADDRPRGRDAPAPAPAPDVPGTDAPGEPAGGSGWHGATWSRPDPAPVQHIDVTD